MPYITIGHYKKSAYSQSPMREKSTLNVNLNDCKSIYYDLNNDTIQDKSQNSDKTIFILLLGLIFTITVSLITIFLPINPNVKILTGLFSIIICSSIVFAMMLSSINDGHSTIGKYTNHREASQIKNELLTILNSVVINKFNNKIMKLYQLMDIEQSVPEKLIFDVPSYYSCAIFLKYDRGNHEFIKVSDDEYAVIQAKANTISNFTHDDLNKYLKIIAMMDRAKQQQKLIEYDKKYQVDNDIAKKKMEQYQSIMNKLITQYNDFSNNIELLNKNQYDILFKYHEN